MPGWEFTADIWPKTRVIGFLFSREVEQDHVKVHLTPGVLCRRRLLELPSLNSKLRNPPAQT